jgi:hypothetical protein
MLCSIHACGRSLNLSRIPVVILNPDYTVGQNQCHHGLAVPACQPMMAVNPNAHHSTSWCGANYGILLVVPCFSFRESLKVDLVSQRPRHTACCK